MPKTFSYMFYQVLLRCGWICWRWEKHKKGMMTGQLTLFLACFSVGFSCKK